jgi:hypothetical protein
MSNASPLGGRFGRAHDHRRQVAFEISSPMPEMSRGEIRRLRRGELGPAETAAWMQRTGGLTAPDAPAEGDLPANGTGWLLGLDPVGGRLHPRLALALSCGAGAGALLVKLADLVALHRPPLIVAMMLGALIPLVSVGLFELAVRSALQRHLCRAARPVHLDDVAPGSLVCLTGVIPLQPSVPTLFRGVPAVLFRDCVDGADEMRGIDFDVDLDGGQQARVCVRRALLLDRPTRAPQPPACGPVHAQPAPEAFGARLRSALLVEPSPLFRTSGARRESSVGPGDRVEVTGVLHRELAPDAADPFARVIPTCFVLRAGTARPLLVRRPSR